MLLRNDYVTFCYSKCEEIFHGRCSGIDNTIVTYGGAIEWSGGEFSQLEVTNPPRVLIVDTHVERSTSKLVESVRLRRERQLQVVENIFNAIDSVVEKLISLLNNSDLIHSYNNQKELFEMNQHLLSSLGKCSKSDTLRRIFKLMMGRWRS